MNIPLGLPNDAQKAVQELIDTQPLDKGKLSDGYHTFEELYDHRIQLYIQLAKSRANSSNIGWIDNTVWRSKAHSDGSVYEGWFLLGIAKQKGLQITYHLPVSEWDNCYFAEELNKAPEWDGHTSAQVLERIKNM